MVRGALYLNIRTSTVVVAQWTNAVVMALWTNVVVTAQQTSTVSWLSEHRPWPWPVHNKQVHCLFPCQEMQIVAQWTSGHARWTSMVVVNMLWKTVTLDFCIHLSTKVSAGFSNKVNNKAVRAMPCIDFFPPSVISSWLAVIFSKPLLWHCADLFVLTSFYSFLSWHLCSCVCVCVYTCVHACKHMCVLLCVCMCESSLHDKITEKYN